MNRKIFDINSSNTFNDKFINLWENKTRVPEWPVWLSLPVHYKPPPIKLEIIHYNKRPCLTYVNQYPQKMNSSSFKNDVNCKECLRQIDYYGG